MKTTIKKAKKKKSDYWTIDRLIKKASKFHNLKELKKKYPDAVKVIVNGGIAEDIAMYFKKVYTVDDYEYWNIPKIIQEASQTSSLDELKLSLPVAYDFIITKNLVEKITPHFLKIKQLEPEFLFRKPAAVTPEDNERVLAHRYYNQIKSYLKEGEKLNYMFDDFMTNMAEKMHETMSWSNFGTVWEITHKKPRIDFALNKPSGPKHYALENLIPKFISE